MALLQITLKQINSYKTDKEFLDSVPPKVRCYDLPVFDALCARYKKLGIKFVADVSNYEVKR